MVSSEQQPKAQKPTSSQQAQSISTCSYVLISLNHRTQVPAPAVAGVRYSVLIMMQSFVSLWFPNACYATGISHYPQDAAPLLAQGYSHLHRHQFSTLSFLNTESVLNTTGLQINSLLLPNFINIFFFQFPLTNLTMMDFFETCYCSYYNYYY